MILFFINKERNPTEFLCIFEIKLTLQLIKRSNSNYEILLKTIAQINRTKHISNFKLIKFVMLILTYFVKFHTLSKMIK